MVFRDKECPKCKADIWLDLDDYGWYEQCTVCDYFCRFEGIKYMDGVESVVVSRQDKLEVHPLHATVETLKKMMRIRVLEARVYILTELTKGAIERRKLRALLKQAGIFKNPFDAALKELKDAGIITTVKAAGKAHRSKLALAT